MKRRIFSVLLALILALAVLPGTAEAADKSGSCGSNLTWTLDKTGVLTIEGSGAMANYSYAYGSRDQPWYSVRDAIAEVVIQKGAKTIGAYAFAHANSLTDVTIPAGVVSIGTAAFGWCNLLNSITIPDGVTSIGAEAFVGCGLLTKVDLPSNMTSIGEGAFKDCRTLSSVSIPSGVTSIAQDTFRSCSALNSVSIPVSVKSIVDDAFWACNLLSDVYYAGTEEQWDEIKIGDRNTALTNVKIHYNSGSTTDPEEYTVTLDPTGGELSGDDTLTVAKGEKYGDLPTPTRSGYTFKGWYTARTGGSRVTSGTTFNKSGDQTLYAHWTKNATTTKVKITLNANGGKVSPTSVSVTKNAAYLDELPTPTRSGYEFAGWYTARTGGTKITSTTKATAARTVYAHWNKASAPKVFLVTFDANGGTVNQQYAAVANGGIYHSLPTPTCPGRHFLGWYTAKTGGTKVTAYTRVNLTANRTLYARWSTSAVTVSKSYTGSWTVTVPAGDKLPLYNTNTTAAVARTAAASAKDTSYTCTRMVRLSNGAVRFYTKTGGKNYWFTYSDEMSVK